MHFFSTYGIRQFGVGKANYTMGVVDGGGANDDNDDRSAPHAQHSSMGKLSANLHLQNDFVAFASAIKVWRGNPSLSVFPTKCFLFFSNVRYVIVNAKTKTT